MRPWTPSDGGRREKSQRWRKLDDIASSWKTKTIMKIAKYVFRVNDDLMERWDCSQRFLSSPQGHWTSRAAAHRCLLFSSELERLEHLTSHSTSQFKWSINETPRVVEPGWLSCSYGNRWRCLALFSLWKNINVRVRFSRVDHFCFGNDNNESFAARTDNNRWNNITK